MLRDKLTQIYVSIMKRIMVKLEYSDTSFTFNEHYKKFPCVLL